MLFYVIYWYKLRASLSTRLSKNFLIVVGFINNEINNKDGDIIIKQLFKLKYKNI